MTSPGRYPHTTRPAAWPLLVLPLLLAWFGALPPASAQPSETQAAASPGEAAPAQAPGSPPLFTVELTLDPPRSPNGQPWQVEITNIDDPLALDHPDRAPKPRTVGEGVYQLREQRPGRYWVFVRNAAASFFAERRDLVIHGPEDARPTLDMAPVSLEGRVTAGEHPIAGTLYLSQVKGRGLVHLELAPNGAFHGRLPEAGAWTLTVRAGVEELVSTEVEVAADAHGAATLDVRLPATRIFGRVVDAEGKPLRHGRAEVWGAGPRRELQADEGGYFEAIGLPPGRLGVRGRGVAVGCASPGDPRLGEEREVDLEEGRALGPLTLRLLPTRPVAGRLSRKGAGFRDGWRMYATTDSGGSSVALGGKDGSFAFDLPKEAREATLVTSLGPPPVQIFHVKLDGSALRLQGEERKGALEIALPGVGKELAEAGQTLELEYRGGLVPFFQLGRGDLEGQSSRSLTLTDLPVGPYRACLGPSGFFDRIDGAARARHQTICAEGRVESGKTLRLAIQR